MDTSDGLAPKLEELSQVNKLAIEVDLANLSWTGTVPPPAGCRPEVYWFGWGDWTVVTAVSSSALGKFAEFCKANEIKYADIGQFIEGEPSVILRNGATTLRATRLESERFAADSWFREGIQAYEKRLFSYPLP
jgi:thiamine monophosphate kinase